jgi:hypothetical protein
VTFLVRRPRRNGVLLTALFAFGCGPHHPVMDARPLPEIPVYEIAPTDSARLAISPAPSRDPIADLRATKRVSLTASNADARTLLLWLAEQAGVSLVVAPDVTARVSVTFTNVPAGDAMRAIIAEAGLSLLAADMRSPWPPVVFFERPVNINEATAAALMSRFGVSEAMAKWIVESRPRP